MRAILPNFSILAKTVHHTIRTSIHLLWHTQLIPGSPSPPKRANKGQSYNTKTSVYIIVTSDPAREVPLYIHNLRHRLRISINHYHNYKLT